MSVPNEVDVLVAALREAGVGDCRVVVDDAGRVVSFWRPGDVTALPVVTIHRAWAIVAKSQGDPFPCFECYECAEDACVHEQCRWDHETESWVPLTGA